MVSEQKADVWGNLNVLSRCKTGLIGVAIASALLNILTLTGSFYMLEVYDRVIPSRSIPSLVAISILALLLYIFQAVFDIVRGRMFARIAAIIDETLEGEIFSRVLRSPLSGKGETDHLMPVKDMDMIRAFVAGSGPAALFDLPWLPFYIIICFMFHTYIGLMAIFGIIVLSIMTYMTHQGTNTLALYVSKVGSFRYGFAQSAVRNAEVVQAMGMGNRIGNMWSGMNLRYRDSNTRAADVSNGYSSVSKVVRMVLQSAVLALGALLVIEGKASGGIIIAGSILVTRALAPAEMAIANWKGLVNARQALARIKTFLNSSPQRGTPLALDPPKNKLEVERLYGAAPGSNRMVLSDVSFSVPAGSALGVIGPSACGKSTLARILIGLWPRLNGQVKLDGAGLDRWDPEFLGRHIGYLPQDVELFGGTIAQNISRFEEQPSPQAIVAAARAARVHEMILQLPNGYETEIGPGGLLLSGGQRQRLALARALYGDPFLVVLDEPNSNLDAAGEQALNEAIASVRARGGIVIVIAHRPSALAAVDLVLMMYEGRVAAFGPRDEVLSKVTAQQAPPAAAAVEREKQPQLKAMNSRNTPEVTK
jgi:ATP-binding cassette subfamily C protein PrsD